MKKIDPITIVFALFGVIWGTLVIKEIIPPSRGCDSGFVCIGAALLIVLLSQMFLVDYKFYNNEINKIREDKISFVEALCNSLSIFGILGIFMYFMDTFNSESDILLIGSLVIFFVCEIVRAKTEKNK